MPYSWKYCTELTNHNLAAQIFMQINSRSQKYKPAILGHQNSNVSQCEETVFCKLFDERQNKKLYM